uniref:Uncharacterized protein n=1 Tax=Chromera velia CCMP2878 TaxID=1169474 RepID=A0A0G4FJB0_9ALVE|eukprot:Cvel_17329.t1-p1 / transcript=Cvel_17329.t1 / gene=Cvel_17329 / organism=Chromera_velia_CCMP2878 / gene_product=hypothetical protein / transcript_product=hypothetical protein / location=Cvel_scaffold1376:46919-47893(+) / protein_length=215 / sequence_SO=supercontig / SO=protein_coding / is_pseudo=false
MLAISTTSGRLCVDRCGRFSRLRFLSTLVPATDRVVDSSPSSEGDGGLLKRPPGVRPSSVSGLFQPGDGEKSLPPPGAPTPLFRVRANASASLPYLADEVVRSRMASETQESGLRRLSSVFSQKRETAAETVDALVSLASESRNEPLAELRSYKPFIELVRSLQRFASQLTKQDLIAAVSSLAALQVQIDENLGRELAESFLNHAHTMTLEEVHH